MYDTVTHIDREAAQWLISGWVDQTQEEERIGSELMKVRAVANAVVKRMHELDVHEQPGRLSPLRKPELFSRCAPYPVHGVIVVDNIAIASDLENYVNRKFQSEPSRFPKSRGWRAITTHSQARQPFDNTHPFFYYRETGRLSQNSSRILIVVDRATEGMNNRYLTVMGVAKRTRSVLEMVQRLGRLIRSAHYADKNGALHAPALPYDMVHVITHMDDENGQTIERAFQFLRDMRGALEEMLDIETYADHGIDATEDEGRYTPRLSFDEQLTITDIVGEAILADKRLSVKKILNRFPTQKRGKRDLITKFARLLYARNQDAAKRVVKDLFRADLPHPLDDLVIDDRIRIDPLSPNELEQWCQTKGLTNMLALADRGSPEWINAVQEIHRAIEGLYYQGAFSTTQTATGTLEELTATIAQTLRLPATRRAVVQHLVENAALDLLGQVGATLDRLADDGDLNIPAVVVQLRKPEWRADVRRWVLWEMYRQGYLKNMAPFIEMLNGTEAA